MQQECRNHECAHVNSSFQHIIGPVLIEQRDGYARRAKEAAHG